MTSSTSSTHRTAERVATLEATERLAGRILGATRTRPIVVVTTVHGAGMNDAAPLPLDPQHQLDEVGDVADIVVLPTGELSMRLDDLLPAMLQVYGGAGRSYPVGLAADPDWRRSPLRFPGRAPERALDQLVSDAVARAHAAGLFAQSPTRTRRVAGEVRGFIAGGSRALVVHDGGGMSTIWAELTAPPTPLDWLIIDGCRVVGLLDEDTNRLIVDVREASDAVRGAMCRPRRMLHPICPVLRCAELRAPTCGSFAGSGTSRRRSHTLAYMPTSAEVPS